MILGTYEWQNVEGVITPGGDTCWRCPSCGGDEHVCGIESLYTSHHECKECKTKLIYPWERKMSKDIDIVDFVENTLDIKLKQYQRVLIQLSMMKNDSKTIIAARNFQTKSYGTKCSGCIVDETQYID